MISRCIWTMLIFKNQGLVDRSRVTKMVSRGEKDSPPEGAENQHKTQPVLFMGGGGGGIRPAGGGQLPTTRLRVPRPRPEADGGLCPRFGEAGIGGDLGTR